MSVTKPVYVSSNPGQLALETKKTIPKIGNKIKESGFLVNGVIEVCPGSRVSRHCGEWPPDRGLTMTKQPQSDMPFISCCKTGLWVVAQRVKGI
jgi:hypothetical protein